MKSTTLKRIAPYLIIIALVLVGALVGRFFRAEIEAADAQSMAEDAYELAKKSGQLAEEAKEQAEENESRIERYR